MAKITPKIAANAMRIVDGRALKLFEYRRNFQHWGKICASVNSVISELGDPTQLASQLALLFVEDWL